MDEPKHPIPCPDCPCIFHLNGSVFRNGICAGDWKVLFPTLEQAFHYHQALHQQERLHNLQTLGACLYIAEFLQWARGREPRDSPDLDCEDFDPSPPLNLDGPCEGDGHYRCPDCKLYRRKGSPDLQGN